MTLNIDIQSLYIYIYIYIYTYDSQCFAKVFLDSRHKVSLTWDLTPRPLDFCSDALPTELISLNKDDLPHSMSIGEVTSKHTNLCLVVSSRASPSPT